MIEVSPVPSSPKLDREQDNEFLFGMLRSQGHQTMKDITNIGRSTKQHNCRGMKLLAENFEETARDGSGLFDIPCGRVILWMLEGRVYTISRHLHIRRSRYDLIHTSFGYEDTIFKPHLCRSHANDMSL